jgi:CheY-like chemotaxis protein
MGKRVLVVDDEVVVLGAVRKALKLTDCTVDTLENALEALKVLGTTSYDVLITDLMMPGFGGLELIGQVHALPSPPAVIVITGYPTIETALKARRLGAFEYVTKPFTRQELASAVVRAFRHRAAAQPRENQSASAPESPEAYFIPEHSWVRIRPDGGSHVGMARAFAAAIGRIKEIHLPARGDLLEQGRICAEVCADDGVKHSLYSPLSGRVIEINQALVTDPE